MRILDESGIEIPAYDPKKGYTKEETILVKHHDAVEAIPEKGHYKTVKVYPNGGKDVEWVVDTPGVEAKEAWDEYETVLQFVSYSASELAHIRISELKQKLQETDYHILKIVEGATTLKECAEIIAQRAGWRKEINDLEKEVE